MIIKVVELAKIDDTYTSLNTEGDISQPANYSLCETFVNVDHIVSFREVSAQNYGDAAQDLGLDPRQNFTHVTLSESRRGITIVDNPTEFQKKINQTLGASPELLRG